MGLLPHIYRKPTQAFTLVTYSNDPQDFYLALLSITYLDNHGCFPSLSRYETSTLYNPLPSLAISTISRVLLRAVTYRGGVRSGGGGPAGGSDLLQTWRWWRSNGGWRKFMASLAIVRIARGGVVPNVMLGVTRPR